MSKLSCRIRRLTIARSNRPRWLALPIVSAPIQLSAHCWINCHSTNWPSESDEAVNLRQIRRSYDRAVKLPESLVAELAETGSKAHHAWVEARQQDHFASFAPWLHKMIALKQQQADCLRQANEPRYDALLDEYEPGAKSSDISQLFAQLRQQLVPVVEQVVGAKRKPDVGILHRHFPQAAQETFGKRVIAQLGFDFEAGRVDRSAHPFCTTLGPRDVRLTTRFNEQAFESAFFGMMHEAGHGMYEQGLPAEHFGTPRGEAVSLSVHESQSRLWENTVGRSLGFWKYWFPHAQKQFPPHWRKSLSMPFTLRSTMSPLRSFASKQTN